MTGSINILFGIALALTVGVNFDIVLCNDDDMKRIEYLYELEFSKLITSDERRFLEDEPIGHASMVLLEEIDAMSNRSSSKILDKVQDLVTEWERQLSEVKHSSELRKPRFFNMYLGRKQHELEVSLTYGYYYLSFRLLTENRLLEALAEIDYLMDLRTRSNGVPSSFVSDMEQKILSAIRNACNDDNSIFQLLGSESIDTLDELEKSHQRLSNYMSKCSKRDISAISLYNLDLVNKFMYTLYVVKKSLLKQAP